MRYFIVDDDTASRKMLYKIITENNIGLVIGEAGSGKDSISSILSIQPDFVLIDLLMPELDGIETIEHLKNEGFQGQFIMISQVIHKDMVGEAYDMGIEFFIHKPINQVEVTSVLHKTKEQFQLKDSLIQIRESLGHITSNNESSKKKSVSDITFSILNNMGVVGEAGSEDIVQIIKIAMRENSHGEPFPSLKNLYEAVAKESNNDTIHIKKESKAIEQRIRRTIMTAVNNLATLGSVDYTNPEFEYYAPRYFDFQEVRKRMIQIQEEDPKPTKIKVNIRKFLHALYLEAIDNYHQY